MTDGWPRYDLYVITDPALSRGRSHIEVARAALEGGADAIQIRDKSSTAYNLSRVTAEIQPLARKFGVGLVVRTASKPGAGEPLGLGALAQIAAAVSIPVVAIGGINADNVLQVF